MIDLNYAVSRAVLAVAVPVALGGCGIGSNADPDDEVGTCPEQVLEECYFNMCGRDNDCDEDAPECERTSCDADYHASEQRCTADCFAALECDAYAAYHRCLGTCQSEFADCTAETDCAEACGDERRDCNAACVDPEAE